MYLASVSSRLTRLTLSLGLLAPSLTPIQGGDSHPLDREQGVAQCAFRPPLSTPFQFYILMVNKLPYPNKWVYTLRTFRIGRNDLQFERLQVGWHISNVRNRDRRDNHPPEAAALDGKFASGENPLINIHNRPKCTFLEKIRFHVDSNRYALPLWP